jgi:hypothetical protein
MSNTTIIIIALVIINLIRIGYKSYKQEKIKLDKSP